MFYEFYFLPVFAGAKCGLRGSQVARNTFFKRVRDTEHTLRGPFYLLKGRHGLSEILERGACVDIDRRRVNPPHPERDFISFAENAPRHGDYFAQHRSGLFKAL